MMALGNFITLIQRFASGRIIVMLLVPAMIIYSIMIFYTIPLIEQYAAGMKLFDLSPTGYSFDYALQLLQALGISGRDNYLYWQLPLDFLYPGLFSASCSLLLSWLLTKSVKSSSKLYYLCLVPVAAGVFDYLENICIIYMLNSYPEVIEWIVVTASTFTVLKSVLTTLFFVSLCLCGILLWFHQRKE